MLPRAALAFCVCFAPRLAYLLWSAPAGVPDVYYWQLSDSLLQQGTLALHGRLTTAFEPLYPAFLAAARWLTGDRLAGVLLLQIAVASAGAVLFHRLCLLLTRNARVAWIGVLLYSLNPYAIHQSVQILEVTLVTTLLIALALQFTRIDGVRSAFAAGLALGIALLARVALLPLGLLALALLLWRRRVPQAIGVAVAAVLLVAPMAIRNHAIDGSLLFSRSGENLFFGNNPLADDIIPDYNTDILGEYVAGIARRELGNPDALSDHQMDRYFRGKALQFVREDPLGAMALKLENLVAFFDPLPEPRFALNAQTRLVVESLDSARVENAVQRNPAAESIHVIYWSLVSLAALAGLWLRRREFGRDAMLYLTLLAFLAVCVVYFPATRLQAPAGFVTMFFAAVALARWTRRA